METEEYLFMIIRNYHLKFLDDLFSRRRVRYEY